MKECFVVQTAWTSGDTNTFVFHTVEEALQYMKTWFCEQCEEVGYTEQDIKEIWEEGFEKGYIEDPEHEFWAELIGATLVD